MNNPVKILFAVENREEFNELAVLLRELLSTGPAQRVFILFKTHAIYQLADYTGAADSLFVKTYTAKNPFAHNFKQLSALKKIIVILVNAPILIRIFRHDKITHILSGVPLIFHRILILLYPSILHLAYVRGVLLFGRKTTSVSDRFFFLTEKLRSIISLRFFNNFYADCLFTIGSLNQNTLRERNIPVSNIYLSGPLLLDRYPAVQDKPEDPERKKELIYITQAYLWHLDTSGHNEQLHSIHGLLQSITAGQAGQFDICIRIHPRDDKRIYEEFLRNYSLPVRIDTSPAAEFLQGISRCKILISGLSTLAFEWIFLGGSCAFLSTEKLLKESREIYDRLGLSPYLKPGEILQDILADRIPNCSEQIDRIFYRHPCGNLKYTVDKINSILMAAEHS
jgi:hypothetical protein